MIIGPDMLLENGPGRYEPSKVAEAWASCFRKIRDAAADPKIRSIGFMVGIPGSGKTTTAPDFDSADVVIFDAVWAHAGRRRAFVSRLRMQGVRSFAVWTRCPLRVALERNAERPEWRRVPRRNIVEADAMLRRAPPSKLDGFSRVFIVRTDRGRA